VRDGVFVGEPGRGRMLKRVPQYGHKHEEVREVVHAD